MTKYFFKWADYDHFDDVGIDYPDLGTAMNATICGIRAALSEDILRGILDLGGRVEVMAEGAVVGQVGYRDALTVLG